jgi:Tfp pilus tip-associated adhesin PilY1
MKAHRLTAIAPSLVALIALAAGVQAAPTQLAEAPLSGASTVQIFPNILFVLDDSFSMSYTALPDWAVGGDYQTQNPGFNGIAYNPAVTYSPPVYYNADGSANLATYPSQTSAATNGWQAVPEDGYGIQSRTTSNLAVAAFYYTTVAGEYCTDKTLRTCVAASEASPMHPLAAPLRWCNSEQEAFAAQPSANACRATQTDAEYKFPRMPEPHTSTLTINAGGSVTGITVAGSQILSSAVSADGPGGLASNLATAIQACSRRLTGNCQVVGYQAEAVDNVVTITAPAATPVTPVVLPESTITATPFGLYGANQAPGDVQLTVITGSRDQYPKAATRTDCGGPAVAHCTYAQEMTNYANWRAYYHTRMQSMKTATSLSFSAIDQTRRVGYMSINNNTGSDFLNISEFSPAQKKAWYDKLFAATPHRIPEFPRADTPLRVALSNAGHLYAGKYNNRALNGVAVTDPMQYYCQKNNTILSTDGYWNQGDGFKLDNSAVGDQDGNVDRPQFDGGAPQEYQIDSQILKTRTPTRPTQRQMRTQQLQSTNIVPTSSTQTLVSRTTPLKVETSQLQARARNLQISTLSQNVRLTFTLQASTKQLQTKTKTRTQSNAGRSQYRESQLQTQTSTLEIQTQPLIQTTTQVEQRTRSGLNPWSRWTPVDRCEKRDLVNDETECRTRPERETEVASCTPTAGVNGRPEGAGDDQYDLYVTGKSCRYGAASGWAPAAATCTTQTRSQGGEGSNWVGPATECRYSAPSVWNNTLEACTPTAASPASPYEVRVARNCRYSGFGAWSDWVAPADCVPLTEDNAQFSRPVARQCQYNYAGWVDTPACVEVLPPARNPTLCRVEWTDWRDSAQACTPNAQTECRYGAWSAYSPVAACSAVEADFIHPIARQCSELTEENVESCTPDIPNRVFCDVRWTNWADIAAEQCNPDAVTRCRIGSWSAWSDANACTPAAPAADNAPILTVARECRYTGQTPDRGWTTVSPTPATCTNQPESPTFAVGLATRCSYEEPEPWQPAPDGCTVTGENGFVNPKTECRYLEPTLFVDDETCPESAVAASPGSPYTVGVARTCSTRSEWVNAANCPDAQNCRWFPADPPWQDIVSELCPDGEGAEGAQTVDGLTTTYRCVTPPETKQFVADCPFVDQIADASNRWVTTHCTTTTSQTDVGLCTPREPADCPAEINQPDRCKRTSCGSRARGATPDTLADVAQYYYMTDLRTPALGNCAPNGDNARSVCQSPDAADTADRVQRMSTYTLGLGASGLMQYDENYERAQRGDGSDFASIKWLTTADPVAGICSWQRTGDCNWPPPVTNTQTNIDDLWHAAVNGRGSYFSARDPATLAAGISSALASISTARGSIAATTITSPNLLPGANGVFEVSFEVGVWAGDVVKRTVDGATGEVSADAVWSAEEQLRRKLTGNGLLPQDHARRTIHTYDPGVANRLKPFLWDSLSLAEKAYLRPGIGALSQFCEGGLNCLAAEERNSASGENLLKFLRGDSSHEGDLQNRAAFYRQRSTSGGNVHRPLGDISGSEAVYVQEPPWNYVDRQYAEFKQAHNARRGIVYVGANDGMLHAFDATTGEEVWAYIPALVFPRLYKLADKNYPGQHQFTVDGTPVVGDICADSVANCRAANSPQVWKTILVGGLNAGGRGYYAMDITDPENPKALWEFSRDNLGYTYGNPVITKLKNGTWVVIFASGYNNVTPGDGVGRLFIVEAYTGNPIASINGNGTISTAVGDAGAPSGLARISAWANFPDLNNTAERVYGGDLLGNLWRFDINGDIPVVANPPAANRRVYDAQRLVTLRDPNDLPQPITAKPELGTVNNQPVVFVGTGQLLGARDFDPIRANAPRFQTQSFYAIKDRLTDAAYDAVRDLAAFTRWTLQAGVCPANSALCQAGQPTVTLASPLEQLANESDAEFAARQQAAQRESIATAFGASNDGWYIDLPGDGERDNTDASLQRGTIVFNTNRPLEGGACIPRAVSYRYFLDYRTGYAIEGTDGIVGVKIADSLATRASVVLRTDDRLSGLTRTESRGIDLGVVEGGGDPGGGGQPGGPGGGGGEAGGGPTAEGPQTISAEVPTVPPADAARRISWRELTTD